MLSLSSLDYTKGTDLKDLKRDFLPSLLACFLLITFLLVHSDMLRDIHKYL